MKSLTKPFVFLLSGAMLAAGLQSPARSQAQTLNSPAVMTAAMPQTDARTAFNQGRAFLKRGNAEQALVALEQALKLATQANDAKLIGASQDALGDLYNRQGQYSVALAHYQEANKSYAAANDTYNANLMLAKTGDMFFSTGNSAEARSAYSQMNVPKIDTSAAGTVKETQKKASKIGGMFNKAKNIGSGSPTSAVGDAASLAGDVKGTIEEERQTYRNYILYSIYELGMGRLDYSNNQLDSAQTHFNNAQAAANNPLYGKAGQARRWRVASRTALGDIAVQQGRYADAIKLYMQA
ncbi:MAG: tetratricopeptide repeat protein, partial [Acidobacteria bacterium]|nr:tetratricopeptide repeat protein [Acidobacteriota bacterium]